jgi:hypothetical protein
VVTAGRALYLGGWALGLVAILLAAAVPQALGVLIVGGGLLIAGMLVDRQTRPTAHDAQPRPLQERPWFRDGLLVFIACGWIVTGLLSVIGVIDPS